MQMFHGNKDISNEIFLCSSCLLYCNNNISIIMMLKNIKIRLFNSQPSHKEEFKKIVALNNFIYFN